MSSVYEGLTSNSAVTGLSLGPNLHGYSKGKVLCWAVPDKMIGRRNDALTLLDLSPWSPLCLLAFGGSGGRESKEGPEGAPHTLHADPECGSQDIQGAPRSPANSQPVSRQKTNCISLHPLLCLPSKSL